MRLKSRKVVVSTIAKKRLCQSCFSGNFTKIFELFRRTPFGDYCFSSCSRWLFLHTLTTFNKKFTWFTSDPPTITLFRARLSFHILPIDQMRTRSSSLFSVGTAALIRYHFRDRLQTSLLILSEYKGIN